VVNDGLTAALQRIASSRIRKGQPPIPWEQKKPGNYRSDGAMLDPNNNWIHWDLTGTRLTTERKLQCRAQQETQQQQAEREKLDLAELCKQGYDALKSEQKKERSYKNNLTVPDPTLLSIIAFEANGFIGVQSQKTLKRMVGLLTNGGKPPTEWSDEEKKWYSINIAAVLQSMEVPLMINKGVKLLEMQARFTNERLVQGIRVAAANELALDAIEEGEE